VVLETKATAKQKEPGTAQVGEQPSKHHPEQIAMWYEKKKPRPRSLRGFTYNVSTPLGKAFITINENGGEQPFEVFINTSKAGSDTAAVSEAIGRLISYILRLASPVVPRDRLKEVWRQLSGIGGGRSLGFGPNRVRSLPDGVSQVLAEYLESTTSKAEDENRQNHTVDVDEHGLLQARNEGTGGGNGYHYRSESAHAPESHVLKIGDLCPECGQAAVVNEEGCRKCYACSFSEC
jgi:ribonucleoside-diphosphate reductase alpha chain